MTIFELQTLEQDLKQLIHDLKMSEVFAVMRKHDLFQGYQDYEHELMYDKPKGTDYKLFQERLLIFLHKQITSAVGKVNALPALPQVSLVVPEANVVDENEKQALFWLNRGNEIETLEDKILAYDKAISFRPDLAEAYFKRGRAKADLGKYQEAIGDYTQVILLNSHYQSVYFYRGRAKQDLQQYQEAIIDYKQYSSISPQEGAGYYQCAKCYSCLQKKGSTLLYLQKTIQLDVRYKILMQIDIEFNWLRTDLDFKKLVA